MRDYGATGLGVADDTPGVRAALAAALASSAPDVSVYFPAGTYKVCRQSGDPAWPTFPKILDIVGSSRTIRLTGDDKASTTISCWMPGLADPVTNWVNTGDSYVKVARFTFADITGSNLEFYCERLTITGNTPYTGNHGVGGNTTTGDGWDITHKCFRIMNGTPINVYINNSRLKHWKGEIVWGGNHNTVVRGTGADFFGSNASALSVSCCDVTNFTFGAPGDDRLYNGVENFNFNSTDAGSDLPFHEFSRFTGCSFNNTFSFCIVQIGQNLTSMEVTNCSFDTSATGILLSEGAWNVEVAGCTFGASLSTGAITSALGLYPGQIIDGFGNVRFRNNIINMAANNSMFVAQFQTVRGYFEFNSNVINTGSMLNGNFNPANEGFACTGNIINAPGKDIRSYSNDVALWTGTVRNGSVAGTAGNTINDFSGGPTANFMANCDLVALGDNVTAGSFTIDLTNIANIPDGQVVRFTRTSPDTNWVLKANGAWNNFASDLAVPAGDVYLQKVLGKFQVV